MKELIVPDNYDDILADADSFVYCIRGQMTFFPLCCSTGIIKNLTANAPKECHRAAFTRGEQITGVSTKQVEGADYVHQIVRACEASSRPLFFPHEVAVWNALSLILIKTRVGTDDGPDGGYNNFKAAQITMCDRIIADKRSEKFKYSSYNIVFSVDQLMSWLENKGHAFGEFYASPPVPGGHGARVRAGIFTADAPALSAYLADKVELVRAHVLKEIQKEGPMVEAVDEIAAKW